MSVVEILVRSIVARNASFCLMVYCMMMTVSSAEVVQAQSSSGGGPTSGWVITYVIDPTSQFTIVGTPVGQRTFTTTTL